MECTVVYSEFVGKLDAGHKFVDTDGSDKETNEIFQPWRENHQRIR